jgi:hypothetical protein
VGMRHALVLWTAFGITASAAEPSKPDAFAAVRFLEGEWRGEAQGQAGIGTVNRSYKFVLAGKFIEERNTTTYPAQDKNPRGEVHEHRGFFSYDRKNKRLMVRQFHEESFVNTYAFVADESSPQKLVFQSEGFENFDNTWKARETYEIVSADEFVEVFELAPPGKPFELYSRTHLRRIR